MGLLWSGKSGQGIPNKRPSASQRASAHMGEKEYNKNRKQQQAKRPYKGSEEEMNHRMFMFFKK